MGGTGVLAGEPQDRIASLRAEWRTDVNRDHETVRLLCDRAPDGDTTFHCLQTQDVLRDLARLRAMAPNPLGDERIALVKRSQEEVHLDGCFYGDYALLALFTQRVRR